LKWKLKLKKAGCENMSKEAKEDLKRWKRKVKNEGHTSRNKRHGGSYTRPLLLDDFQTKKEGAD